MYTVDPNVSKYTAISGETLLHTVDSVADQKITFCLYLENSAYLANHRPQQFQDMNGESFGWVFSFHANCVAA